MKHPIHVIAPAICAIYMAACGLLPDSATPEPQIASAVTDIEGQARIESASGVIDFEVTSGLSGEKLPGIRIRVAVFGASRLLLASDPTGFHLPFAVPLAGEATVRRLVMPPKPNQNINIATASGPLNLEDLISLGTLSEAEIRERLETGPNEAVLLYLYNPVRPLALTGAGLEAFATPFENVIVLRAGGEPPDAGLALIVVGMNQSAYPSWEHLVIDRYLAGRIGQQPDVDLRGDLAFKWSYPVFEVYPPEETINLREGDSATLRVSWRSQNPDPPPPWSFFVSADSEIVLVEPVAFGLGPDSPSQEITLTVDRSGLTVGEYSVTIFIQPFSETFGLIEQSVERVLTFTVAEALPTPTSGPSTDITTAPAEPRQGDRLVVDAGGFTPGESVLMEFTGTAHNIRDSLATADENGEFHYEIDLSTVPPGTYTLRLTGTESGIVGEEMVVIKEKIADAVVESEELNLRTGPSYDFPVLEVLVRGDTLTVIGKNLDGTWLEVITATGQRGWVLTDLVKLNINLDDVPVS